ncbi:MAG: ATP synthase F1 subunit gamma [Planctomycetales bacterium]|nr:ATP synthase F1 subunit gamma [Planctomycetales bacterium]
MANPRQLDKRRKSIRNIRKITRTMELIATARFKLAMDRATAATAFTTRMTQLVADLAQSGLEVSHPLLEEREKTEKCALLVLTANRGLCGGYNSNVIRLAQSQQRELAALAPKLSVEVSGKRGINGLRFRNVPVDVQYTQFEDKPGYGEVEAIAERYLDMYATGQLDRLDVVYTQFISAARQNAVVETLLPLKSLDMPAGGAKGATESKKSTGEAMYDFLPSAASILEEVVPTSFKVKLFKCFLDAAVSEQISRMIAMKSATEAAGDMIKAISREYNRARQARITNEIMEVIGGSEALA